MTRVGIALAAIGWLLVVSALVLLALAKSNGIGEDLFHFDDAVVGLTFPALGLLLLSHRGSHLIGWILIVMGLSGALGVFGEEYVTYGHEFRQGSLPAVETIAWLGSWTWLFFFSLLPVLLLLFPDGEVLSSRWRVVLGLSIIPSIVLPGALAVSSWGVPIGVLAGAEGVDEMGTALLPIFESGIVFWLATVLVSVVSLALRWRRSHGIRRLQMKMFLSFALAGVLLLVLSQIESPLSQTLSAMAFLLFPAGVTGAILRFRLYDIERLISRTLGYAIVVAMLALLYVGGAVWLPTRILGEQPPLFVAGATLVVAALFNPLRRRVQRVLDRRFYRSRYDPERVVGELTVRLREDIDIEDVTDDLVAVVRRTIQPSVLSIWVRDNP